ncbi:hypothetical protein AYO29_09445 [Coxiella burnetii str. Schperling]|uniref:hypothetical protein n=1 Tax=Coxiella burnetii TaxID=777 RepID=UPI000509B304|nr:hypothetical protein [Coxiella burnetii]ATN86613.1 hypothetical protein AYO29_09445 [Coxiella burnetii str. Schperling]
MKPQWTMMGKDPFIMDRFQRSKEATPLPSNSFHQKKIALGLLLIIDTYGFNIRLRHSRRRESRRTEGALRTCALDSRLRGNDD